MAILVTGGAGYIGSHTVRALLKAKPERRVIVVDNLSTGHRGAIDPRADFFALDICDTGAMQALLQREEVEGVIHFAASSQVGESMEKPLLYYENNLSGTRNLLEAMVGANVRHLVFSSTAAVYGEPEKMPILESTPTKPTNCYGETKLAMEKMIAWASRAHDLNYVALRYFNAAGACPSGEIGEDHKPETHLIPLILQVPQGKREFISVFGEDYDTKDGSCVRDYIHVMDLAEAHVLALAYLEKGEENLICNLGSQTGFTVHEVVSTARTVTGEKIPAQIAPRRAGDPASLVASAQLAHEILGWRPQRAELSQIIEDAWRWHKGNPQGFSDEN